MLEEYFISWQSDKMAMYKG
jgi:hypothetical protein